jgi:GDPmannose 4,6-dehydratase
MQKTAIITGVTGQDGAYLSRLLLERGYRVIGLTRSYNKENLGKLNFLGILEQVEIKEVNLSDLPQLIRLFQQYKPAEVYNLAAQSSVSLSFQQPIGTISFNIISTLNLLEAIKVVDPEIRLYQASSSEMFGHVENLPITEKHALHPLSPYAISKAAAHWTTVNYRESYNMWVGSGILFNHESYLRSPNFFIKKVLRTAVEISHGKQELLEVGNIDIKRDFGYAPAYVEAMWLMLQQEEPDDYIICSGTSLTLRSIIEHVFSLLNIPIDRLVINPDYYRPTDIVDIFGDNSKARTKLGWQYDRSFLHVIEELLEEENRYFSKKNND